MADTRIQVLVINELTKAQYDAAEKDPNQLYYVKDGYPDYVDAIRQDIADMEDSIDGLTDKVNDLYDDYLNASSLL